MTRASRLRTALAAAFIAGAAAFGLSACVSPEDTTAELRGSVVQVAERAATGDYAGALAALALLDRDVTAAADAGRIDGDREQRIRSAMDLVRADLEAASVAATPEPEPAPEPEPEPEPAPDDGDEDNSGPGNNNGNNGNGNNGNSGNNGNGNSGNSGRGNGNGNDD